MSDIRLFHWLGAALSTWIRHFLPLTAMVSIPMTIEVVIIVICEQQFKEMGHGEGALLGLSPAEHVAALCSLPFLFAAWAGSFIFLQGREASDSKNKGWWSSFGRGFGSIAAYFGVHFLIGVAVVALAVPGLVLWKLGVLLPAYVLLGVAGLAFIYLLGRWSLTFPLLAIERGSFSEAMQRSGVLTRPAIGAVVALNVIVMGIPALIEMALNLLDDPLIASFAFSLLHIAFGFTATFVAYKDLRAG